MLILSEFAGAAQSLGAGAILVNPWNITDMAAAIEDALTMSDQAPPLACSLPCGKAQHPQQGAAIFVNICDPGIGLDTEFCLRDTSQHMQKGRARAGASGAPLDR